MDRQLVLDLLTPGQEFTFLDKIAIPQFPGFYEFVAQDQNAEQMQHQFIDFLVSVARLYLENGQNPYFCFPLNGTNEMLALFAESLLRNLPAPLVQQILCRIRLIAKYKTGEFAPSGRPVSEYVFDGGIEDNPGTVLAFVDEIIDSCDTVLDSMEPYIGKLPLHVFTLTSKTDTISILADRGLSASVMRTFPHNADAKDSWITAGGWMDWGVYPQHFSLFDIARIKVKERLCSKFVGFYPSEGMPQIDMEAYERYLDVNLRQGITQVTIDRMIEMELAYAGNDTQLQFQLMHAWQGEYRVVEA